MPRWLIHRRRRHPGPPPPPRAAAHPPPPPPTAAATCRAAPRDLQHQPASPSASRVNTAELRRAGFALSCRGEQERPSGKVSPLHNGPKVASLYGAPRFASRRKLRWMAYPTARICLSLPGPISVVAGRPRWRLLMPASPGVRVAFREVGLTLMISGDRLVRVADADAIAKHTHATATHHRSRATPTEFRPLSKGIGPFLLRSVSGSNFPRGMGVSPLDAACPSTAHCSICRGGCAWAEIIANFCRLLCRSRLL